MDTRLGLFLIMALLVFSACGPIPMQYPPGSAQSSYPNSGTPADPQPAQISGSQRMQYAWNKAMEGVAMGGAIAGPYGAGGGLIIG